MSDAQIPASQRAEEALVGSLLSSPAEVVPQAMETGLSVDDFFYRPYRLVFETIVEAHYADAPMDALSIAESISKRAAEMWKIEEREAVDKILALTKSASPSSAMNHMKVVKRHADYRKLAAIAQRTLATVNDESEEPEEIAALVSAQAMRVATSQKSRGNELVTYAEAGKRWYRHALMQIEAREQGIELGANFDMPWIDSFTLGLQPTELMMAGGEAGVGKSALWWAAAENFALRQMPKPADQRVGTLVLSLEMGEVPSDARLAQAVGGLDGEKLRRGTLTKEEARRTAERWAARKGLPLVLNHASTIRMAQLRAIVAESIRRFNTGLVIVDHFRMLRPDDKTLRGNEADDDVVMGLKEMAIDFNVAVICLAHTVKGMAREDRRPRMSDLRGSGMIAAFADFVCFVYRPWLHATAREREEGDVSELDAELIWEKSRHSGGGTGYFAMNLARMQVLPPIPS